MNILILEDNDSKFEAIVTFINTIHTEFSHERAKTYKEYLQQIERKEFDLIIADLIIPRFQANESPCDATSEIIQTTRDLECKNYSTPIIVLTEFDEAAEENFRSLNKKNITVVTYSNDNENWKEALKDKLLSSTPEVKFDFIILCALEKEAKGFLDAGYSIGDQKSLKGFETMSIEINRKKGLIIVCPRMGLVSCAITASRAIEVFRPKLICMSGICAGISGNSNIYDVIITETCHQHDFGKWVTNGFQHETYSVQLHHDTRLKIREIIAPRSFKETLERGITLLRSEIPEDCEKLDFNVALAATSSGSSVVASEAVVNEVIKIQHRKVTAFEMETFAVYEAARTSTVGPKFFSAKSVVDNGGSAKGDLYHRAACILSAKTVYTILQNGLL